MDDDIDIEEHDLMDNPRIKCIFPDLSCVKIEIPDEEDIVKEEQYGGNSIPTEETPEMLYQYEYSFETTNGDQLAANLHYEEEEGDNATYFYNNEIILGSKPPADPDVLYQEALHSQPIIYLENWEYRLKTSPCFCDSCEILFPTVNALDAHKMISHSYLVAMETPQRNTARKSTVTSKFCNHCSKMFPDDTSLIKHLYELLPLNNFSPVKEEIKEPENSKTFATPMMWPKKKKQSSHVVSKIHLKEEKPDLEDREEKRNLKSKLPRDGKFFAASSLVPKSTLFQCNVCQVSFLSCFSASQHAKCCEKVLTFNKCGICKRKIRTKDFKIHELQHNYNDKLKIYTMNKSIYERLLCKCPKCLSCFDELGFWAHYQKCKSEKKSIYCSDCDVHISSSRYKGHRLKHSIKKLTKKDFIIIEFYDKNNIKIISEDRIEEMRAQRTKERLKKYREKKMNLKASRKDRGIFLYYCEFCGCCQYILNYKGHTNGSCKFITTKKFCQKCGLCFTNKGFASHLLLHQKRSFSLKDIKIYSMMNGKEIDPPMSEFYECKTCSKHFISRRTMSVHNCKTEKFVTCKICTKKFNLQAYKIHKMFHSVDKLMPELMKKYNLINSMWNVMFMCVSCELVTMTYDAAVTHSQGHLNYIISDLHKQCVVCDLRIAEKEFSLHEKLHSNNDSIERESFKILKYNFEDLFKKEWLMLFDELPNEHRHQILSKSIHRFTRSVKMQIEVSASTDDTKYFCMNCNIFVDGININQHVRSKCCQNNKLVCDTCQEVFKSLKQFLAHEGSHENSSKRQTIVTFNNECDREFNNHLSLIESKSKDSTKDVPLSKLRELLLSNNVKATHKLYKCAKCETCVTLQSSIARHSCVPAHTRRLCEICEQYFSNKKIHMHIEAHRKKPSLTKDSFFVAYFNCEQKTAKRILNKRVIAKLLPEKDVNAKVSPKKDVTAKVSPKKTVIAKIFECKCGLHFTSMKTVEKHLDECNPNLEVSKETCSKCNLVFPTDVLVTHLINHHHKETKIVIEKLQKVELYKCPACALIFTNMDNFNAHTEDCKPTYGIHCMKCRLTFSKKCYPKHLCSTEDIKYINKITVVRKIIRHTTVHRCNKCDISYLRRNSFKYHYFDVNHVTKKPPTACDVCGLQFTNCSYKKHIEFHNFVNDDYKIKVIEPISGDFYFITGKNRSKHDGNTDSERLHRKRKSDSTKEDCVLGKRSKRILGLNDEKSERMCTRKSISNPSTSRDFDDTTTEIIVPDQISDHTTDNNTNVNDSDNIINVSDFDFKANDSTTVEMGLSTKLRSRILVKGYSNKLYKCVYCQQHYMKEPSFMYHVKNHRHHEESENYKCDVCDFEFSRHTLPRHKYVHHVHMRLKKEDFIIVTDVPDLSIKKLKAKNPFKIHDVPAESQKENAEGFDETAEGLDETAEGIDENAGDIDETAAVLDETVELQDDTAEDSENDSAIAKDPDPSDVNVSDICDTISEINDNVSESDKICYYKCSDCNVCFLDDTSCFEHTFKHEILDPKTYITCKICEFQFLIDSLKEHVILHHNSDFLIETLTIHEYKPLDFGLDPKIDIYQAIDKVQSRLVSTTTDVGVV